MNPAPFLSAPVSVQVHMLAALVVLALTPIQFAGFRKGSVPHRFSGYVWLSGMAVLALSSFFIAAEVGPSVAGFGFIHLLSVLILLLIVRAVAKARSGDVAAHRRAVIIAAVSFMVAGALAFLPPRIMARILAG
jgi:uncharacterized membrane protein